VRTELKFKRELPYNIYGNVRPWNWSTGRGRTPSLSVADTLRQAMRDNQFLKVFCANGYYDGATPHFATEYTFAHIGMNSEFKERVRMGYYEAGHMMYIHKASHVKFKKDIADFIKWATEK
jgi:carboxypeptidase C (cathepsin A)